MANEEGFSAPQACRLVGVNNQTGVGQVVPIVDGIPGTAQEVPGTTSLTGVACPTLTGCVAAGGGGAFPDYIGVVVDITVAVSPAPDTTPPTCTVTAVRAGPPKQLDVTAQDTGSGLASITVVSISNGTASVQSFTPGTTSPVVATFTKTNQAKPTVVNVDATDVAGNTTHCR